MTNNKQKFSYDSRLQPEVLEGLKDCIGGVITCLHLENPSISLPPDFRVENVGRCVFKLSAQNGAPNLNLTLESTFRETPPVIDSGGILVSISEEKSVKFQDRRKNADDQNFVPVVPFYYPNDSPISTIEFYGCQERRDLREIDPFEKLDSIKRYGFEDWPQIEVDTIEFMVVNHGDGSRTIVSSQSGGFFYTFLTDQDITLNNYEGYYLEVNMAKKDISLQHTIG